MNDCTHSERIPPGDPRYDGFRIERMWLFVAVDPTDNQEGVIPGPDGLPLIATDLRRVEDVRGYAADFATRYGARVRVILFDVGSEVEVFEP